MWAIEVTEEFEVWWRRLGQHDRDLLDQRIGLLEQQGPGLGRPAVDTITGSSIPNLKELRARSIRVLFVFDPRRTAVLLVGGDKTGHWKSWYVTAIREAERLDQRHLDRLGEGGQ